MEAPAAPSLTSSIDQDLTVVLSPEHRLRRSAEFAAIIRDGRRVRRSSVVVYQLDRLPSTVGAAAAEGTGRAAGPARVGFVVGRIVGNSVVRHRVTRRLRAQLAARQARLPVGSATVVRALPSAAVVTSQLLGAELDAAFARLDKLGGAAQPARRDSRR